MRDQRFLLRTRIFEISVGFLYISLSKGWTLDAERVTNPKEHLSAAAAITKSTERKYSPRIQFYFINLQIFNGFEISLFKNP